MVTIIAKTIKNSKTYTIKFIDKNSEFVLKINRLIRIWVSFGIKPSKNYLGFYHKKGKYGIFDHIEKNGYNLKLLENVNKVGKLIESLNPITHKNWLIFELSNGYLMWSKYGKVEALRKGNGESKVIASGEIAGLFEENARVINKTVEEDVEKIVEKVKNYA